MRPEDIIDTGLLELYAMGHGNSGDRSLVELMLEKDPAIREELARIEEALESMAPALEKPLPTNMKDRIAMRLSFAEPTVGEEKEEVSQPQPVAEPKQEEQPVVLPVEPKQEPTVKPEPLIQVVEKEVVKEVVKEVKVIKMKTPFFFKAAAVAALLSIGFNAYLFMDSKSKDEKVERLSNINTLHATTNDSLKTNIANMEKYKQLLASSQLMVLDLPSVNKEKAGAKVFCDKGSGMTMINNMDLPTVEAPSEMQYQVWAIVDGAPVDIGLINHSAEGVPENMTALKEIHNAQAFAITLEEIGGKPVPNLERLVVMGKVG